MECQIKTKSEYNNLKTATSISKEILHSLVEKVGEGISAWEIEEEAQRLCKKNNVSPAFWGVTGPKSPFYYHVCVSINDEVLHSIPHKHKIFKPGDIVKVDFGIKYNGMHTDHCITKSLGDISEAERRLVETSKLCVETAIKSAVVGNRVGDISAALEEVCNLAKLDYVKTYCGHGIGKKLHLPPEILTYGERGSGMKLLEGMVLCIENQVVLGKGILNLAEDGWSLKTRDGSKGAMTEHMVIVRRDAAEILTA